MTLESQIPNGWRFYTADFSRSNRSGSVMLCRDDEGFAWWNKLSDAEQDLAELYVSGRGATVNEAVADAVSRIGGLLLDRKQL